MRTANISFMSDLPFRPTEILWQQNSKGERPKCIALVAVLLRMRSKSPPFCSGRQTRARRLSGPAVLQPLRRLNLPCPAAWRPPAARPRRVTALSGRSHCRSAPEEADAVPRGAPACTCQGVGRTAVSGLYDVTWDAAPLSRTFECVVDASRTTCWEAVLLTT